MAAKTYYCGNLGTVKRLDDFAGSWVDISIPGVKTLYDIMTSPTDENHVVTVGEGGKIFVSTDAGANWNIPAGNYTTFVPLPNFYEVWFTDSVTIFVVGDGGVCIKSIDGGLTFNATVSLPTPLGTYVPASGSAYCVHFPTPLLGVVGFQDSIFKTIDGGLTWTFTNGGLPINNPQTTVTFRGIEISANGLIITAWGQGCVYRSIDGGLSYSMVLDFIYVQFSARPGEHLTWLNDNVLWGTTRQNEIFQSVNAGASWTSLRVPDTSVLDSLRIRAAHFYTASNGFYSVNSDLYSTADSGATGSLSDTNSFGEIWAVWTHLGQICYVLTSCSGGLGITASTDLSLYVGQYINLGGTCYLVEVATDCTGSIDIGNNFTVFDDCQTCVPLSCFLLVPCTGAGPSHAVTGSFVPGTVVTVEEYPDICFQVLGPITPCTGFPATLVNTYNDCECCLPTPCPNPIITLLATVTYYSGLANLVRVSEDGGTTWNTRSVPSLVPKALLDIKAFPNNSSKAVTVGEEGHIYLTTDKGLSWSEASPVAGTGSAFSFEEVWNIDSLNSVVVGEQVVQGSPIPEFFKSTDGGVNYVQGTIIDSGGYTIFKFGQAISVHFLDPLVGVIGVQGIINTIPGYPIIPLTDEVYVLLTLDGGLTWEVTNNKFPVAPLVPGTKPWGVKITSTPFEYVINVVVDSGVATYRSVDSGLTYTAFPMGAPNLHLTWILDTKLWITKIGGDILISTDIGATWSTQQGGIADPLFAAHFYQGVSSVIGFYSSGNTLFKSLNEGVSGVLSDVTPNTFDIYAVWTEQEFLTVCPPEPVIPFVQSVDPIVKSFSNITDTECTIDTNIDFGDAYYRLYKLKKNGINVCGVKNIDLQWLRKELLDIRLTAIAVDCCIVPPDPPIVCP